MSRALDKDTIRAFGSCSPSAAFEAISKALTQISHENDEELLEIEILGKSHPLEAGTFLVQDENALGISKLGLVQAFFEARTMFQGHQSGKGATLSADRVLAVTSVILLMDPEHLTATNARKRLIRSEGTGPAARQLELIRKDIFFIDSLLTSRLHRHTKSPTLWSHRRWLVEALRGHGVQPDVAEGLRRVVMVAGERHPRNYYAWCHARWLTGLLSQPEEDDELRASMVATKSWCFRHHTDISGWSFLSFLLAQGECSDRSSVFREAASLAASFKWTNESTWVFLRTLAALGPVGDEDLSLFHGTMVPLLGNRESSEDRRYLEQARSWLETYQRRQC